jgi:hypothetical protein
MQLMTLDFSAQARRATSTPKIISSRPIVL